MRNRSTRRTRSVPDGARRIYFVAHPNRASANWYAIAAAIAAARARNFFSISVTDRLGWYHRGRISVLRSSSPRTHQTLQPKPGTCS